MNYHHKSEVQGISKKIMHQHIMPLLDRTFPGRRIGRAGPLHWPPQSPDLTPCDIRLWGMVKERVYGRRVTIIKPHSAKR